MLGGKLCFTWKVHNATKFLVTGLVTKCKLWCVHFSNIFKALMHSHRTAEQRCSPICIVHSIHLLVSEICSYKFETWKIRGKREKPGGCSVTRLSLDCGQHCDIEGRSLPCLQPSFFLSSPLGLWLVVRISLNICFWVMLCFTRDLGSKYDTTKIIMQTI